MEGALPTASCRGRVFAVAEGQCDAANDIVRSDRVYTNARGSLLEYPVAVHSVLR
jgi:hypothetical protein